MAVIRHRQFVTHIRHVPVIRQPYPALLRFVARARDGAALVVQQRAQAQRAEVDAGVTHGHLVPRRFALDQ